jgi:hypothetical protein
MPHVHGISSHDGLNFSKKLTPNKPMEGANFQKQFQAAMDASSLRPLTPADMAAPIQGAIMALQPLIPEPKPLGPLGTSPVDLSHSQAPKSQH